MDEMQMLKIIEQYCRKKDAQYEGTTITRVADRKTVFVEQTGESGRAIVMTEYKVDGATYWAGYSPQSKTVFISNAA